MGESWTFCRISSILYVLNCAAMLTVKRDGTHVHMPTTWIGSGKNCSTTVWWRSKMKYRSLSMFVCLFMLWATPATADGVRDFLGTWEFTGSIGEESFVDEYHLAHVQTHHLSLFGKNGVTGLVGGDLEDGSPVALIPAESHLPSAFVLFDKDMWKEGIIPQCERVGGKEIRSPHNRFYYKFN